MNGCLTELELYQAYRHEMGANESCAALHHILGCPLCHEQWKRFLIDEQMADGIRSAVDGDAEGADDTPAFADELPEQLDIAGFRLKDEYHDGGQARVYRAVHDASQEEVAIKVFHNSALNEGGTQRFKRELRSLARLRHPNVIPIRSDGETLGHAYFVVPWIDGTSLDEYLRQSELSTGEKVDLVMKICSAVDHAHKRGVMHLDLKPSNVLVDRAGEPMVTDFGLARLSIGDRAEKAGFSFGVAGTPEYMAPEQLRDCDDVDTRADVYMLGMLLYEVLAGCRARRGAEDSDAPHEAARGAAALRPIRQVAPRVGRELAAIVGKATTADREARYQTAEALLGDLRRYRSGAAVGAMGDALGYRMRKFSRAHLATVVGVLAVMLIVGAALMVNRAALSYLVDAYGQATHVVRRAELVNERRLVRLYTELSELHARLGDAAQAEEYADYANYLLSRDPDARPPEGEPGTAEAATTSQSDGGGDQ